MIIELLINKNTYKKDDIIMTTFYGVATTQNGVSVLINNLPTNRLGAETEAKRHAAKNGLNFQYIRPVNTAEKKGATLTKNKKARVKAANKR
jgi:uncharacterized RmlC-like cupin family protein